MSYTLRNLRAAGARPRVHGNGFIQLDIDERNRLHIWGDPRIPRQKVATPIHDHVFGFHSTVIVGKLVNFVYDTLYCDDGGFEVYTPSIREGEDTILSPTGLRILPWVSTAETVTANTSKDWYRMLPGVFHETKAPYGPAASIIVKDSPTQAQGAPRKPRVLVPVSAEPDNEFNRYAADENLLWQIIEDTMRRT